MAMKKLLKKIVEWVKSLFHKGGGSSPDLKPAPYTSCVHASCWDGKDAKRRMMNIVSPKFSDAKFEEYVSWMLARGCDTAHVILANGGDGEKSGYNCLSSESDAAVAKDRILKLRKRGLAVVVWLITDDSSKYAEDLFKNASKRIKFIHEKGLLDQASYVVLGLEMDEPSSYPGGESSWKKVASELRKVYVGKVGTHHKSGNSFKYAGLGDIVMGQLSPGEASTSAIKAQVKAIRKKGKLAVGFEYSREPDRKKAQAALDAGAIGVGNW